MHLREELVKMQCFAHSYVVERKNSRSSDLTGLFQPLAAAWVSPTREVSVRGSIRVLPCHAVAIMLCQDHLRFCGVSQPRSAAREPGRCWRTVCTSTFPNPTLRWHRTQTPIIRPLSPYFSRSLTTSFSSSGLRYAQSLVKDIATL